MNSEDLEDIQNSEEVITLKAPRLDPLEKLYVRAYLSKLSHSYAHSVVSPGIKNPKEDNPYSRRDNVQFHISLAMQEKMEALEINPETIIAKLYKEATREDKTASHNARIQALSLLGKQLGMFVEKKEVEKHTFNIINYSDKPIKIIAVDPNESIESEEPIEEKDYSDTLQFTDYKEGD